MALVYPLDKRFHPDFALPNRKPVGPVILRQNVLFLALFRDSSGVELKHSVMPTTFGGTASIGANAGEMSSALDGNADYITWGTQAIMPFVKELSQSTSTAPTGLRFGSAKSG